MCDLIPSSHLSLVNFKRRRLNCFDGESEDVDGDIDDPKNEVPLGPIKAISIASHPEQSRGSTL